MERYVKVDLVCGEEHYCIIEHERVSDYALANDQSFQTMICHQRDLRNLKRRGHHCHKLKRQRGAHGLFRRP